jgi:hypothetical protein
LLVVVLPIAVWDKIGYLSVDEELPYQHHSLKAPNWLNELPYPIGLVAISVVLGALGWLAAEYWVRGWRKWWFVVLGALCLIGAYTAWGGRFGTSGRGHVYADHIPWGNIGGWIFLICAPAVFGALFTIAGIALQKVIPAQADAMRLPDRLRSKPLLVSLSLLPGCLVICVAILWAVFKKPWLEVLSEGVPALIAFVVFYAIVLSPFMLLFLALVAVCLIPAWWILFGSADLVLRRKSHW